MVEVIGQCGVKLRLREVRKALENLIRRHAELVITCDRSHRDARAFDNGHAAQDSRVGREVRILDSVCFHAIKLSHAMSEAKLLLNRKFAAFNDSLLLESRFPHPPHDDLDLRLVLGDHIRGQDAAPVGAGVNHRASANNAAGVMVCLAHSAMRFNSSTSDDVNKLPDCCIALCSRRVQR